MKKVEEFYFLSANGVNKIHGMKWMPEGKPIGVLQLVHGMVEYIERYDHFAKYFTQKGFVVVGHDHLGHGESVTSEEEWGYFSPNGAEDALEDILTLTKKMKAEYLDLPYCILGHSMGSFFVRKFAILYGDLVDAVILTGTGNLDAVGVIGARAIIGMITLFKGDKYKSKFMNNMVLGDVFKRIENPRTSADWLSKDEEIVDLYVANPANQFLFSMNGIRAMVKTIQYVVSFSNVKNIRKDLPILLTSGEEDPIGNYGKDVEKVLGLYQNAGVEDLEMHLFKGDRHEILNELDKEQVYEYIYTWVEEKILNK